MISAQVVMILLLSLIKLRLYNELPWLFVFFPAWAPPVVKYMILEMPVFG